MRWAFFIIKWGITFKIMARHSSTLSQAHYELKFSNFLLQNRHFYDKYHDETMKGEDLGIQSEKSIVKLDGNLD